MDNKYAIGLDVDARAWGMCPIFYMGAKREIVIHWDPQRKVWQARDNKYPNKTNIYYQEDQRAQMIADLEAIEAFEEQPKA